MLLLSWHGIVSRQRLTKTQTWGTVMTGGCSNFRVGVSFRAILLYLISNQLLVAYQTMPTRALSQIHGSLVPRLLPRKICVPVCEATLSNIQ